MSFSRNNFRTTSNTKAMPRIKGQNQTIISVYRGRDRIFTGTKTEVTELFKLHQSTLDRYIRINGVYKGLSFQRVGVSSYVKTELNDSAPLQEKTVKEMYTTSSGVNMILHYGSTGNLINTTFIGNGSNTI